MCSEWRKDFQKFLAHIGKRPGPGYSVDRIDNNKGYEPGNVRWATPKEQARNRRTNTVYEWCGLRLTLAEWAERASVNARLVRERISAGWSFEVALSTPLGQVRKVAACEEPAAVTKRKPNEF